MKDKLEEDMVRIQWAPNSEGVKFEDTILEGRYEVSAADGICVVTDREKTSYIIPISRIQVLKQVLTQQETE